MTNRPPGRGRPRSKSPKSAAERMRAYRARRKAAGMMNVRRWVAASGNPGTYSNHAILDARSLALHCKAAERLAAEPALLDKARGILAKWIVRRGDDVPRDFREWERKLSRPLPELLAFMTAQSDEAVRMRQSSPFPALLTPDVRNRIYEAFRA